MVGINYGDDEPRATRPPCRIRRLSIRRSGVWGLRHLALAGAAGVFGPARIGRPWKRAGIMPSCTDASSSPILIRRPSQHGQFLSARSDDHARAASPWQRAAIDPPLAGSGLPVRLLWILGFRLASPAAIDCSTSSEHQGPVDPDRFSIRTRADNDGAEAHLMMAIRRSFSTPGWR